MRSNMMAKEIYTHKIIQVAFDRVGRCFVVTENGSLFGWNTEINGWEKSEPVEEIFNKE